jgi:hypothetical protein
VTGFYRDARLGLGDIPPAFLKPAEKAALAAASRERHPALAADARFVRGKPIDSRSVFGPGGISAVVCADGKRRTVVEMVKDADRKVGKRA